MRVRNPDARDKLADDFLCATGANIREGHGEAYYVPGHDYISMPVFEAFKGADHFYNVAFHELTHWTGHRSRLDRDLRKRFDLRAYAAEELVAELGAAFLSAEFGFDGDVRNAGYIASWIDLLKSDKRLTLPILPVLQKTLDASPCGDLTFLVNDLGRAFTDAGIGNKMRDWCDQAGLSHCTAHGLRKAGATIAANNGATAHQLKAIFGWDSLKQAEIYTREADQRRLAEDAMPLLDKVRNESSSK